MALYDTADLHRRFLRLARRPGLDTGLKPTDVYAYLTDAQLYWIGQFQVHFPRLNWSVWEKLTAAADNKSYSFSAVPLGRVEIYPSKGATTELIAGSATGGGDFTWEGVDTIRFPGDAPRTFADGPWARYIPRPDDIKQDVQPVLQPPEARLLMVYSALEQWAHEGGLQDPAIYSDLIDGLWLGKRPGDTGLLGQLKTRFGSSSDGRHGKWYHNPDMSNLPVATR